MPNDALWKFEKGLRRLGAIADGFGKDMRGVCDEFGDACAELRGAAPSVRAERSRVARPRAIPAPSRSVSELDQARAERELKKRGFVVGDE